MVKTEVAKFLTRALAEYRDGIKKSPPWRLGMSGGGVPVNTGNLRDTHVIVQRPWDAVIYPSAPYAKYVHGIEGYPRKGKYQLRPWLDFAFNQRKQAVENLEKKMLENIIAGLKN